MDTQPHACKAGALVCRCEAVNSLEKPKQTKRKKKVFRGAGNQSAPVRAVARVRAATFEVSPRLGPTASGWPSVDRHRRTQYRSASGLVAYFAGFSCVQPPCTARIAQQPTCRSTFSLRNALRCGRRRGRGAGNGPRGCIGGCRAAGTTTGPSCSHVLRPDRGVCEARFSCNIVAWLAKAVGLVVLLRFSLCIRGSIVVERSECCTHIHRQTDRQTDTDAVCMLARSLLNLADAWQCQQRYKRAYKIATSLGNAAAFAYPCWDRQADGCRLVGRWCRG